LNKPEITPPTYFHHIRDGTQRYQSGETDVQGGISRCGDELARTALYEAAHSLLIRSTKWSALRTWGMNIAKRRGTRLDTASLQTPPRRLTRFQSPISMLIYF